MIRLMLLVVAASFLSTGAAMANSETDARKEAPGAAVTQPTEAKASPVVRSSTRDRWRGRPYLRAVASPNVERDIQLLPIDQPLPHGNFSVGTIELRNEALDKSLHFAVFPGSALPF